MRRHVQLVEQRPAVRFQQFVQSPLTVPGAVHRLVDAFDDGLPPVDRRDGQVSELAQLPVQRPDLLVREPVISPKVDVGDEAVRLRLNERLVVFHIMINVQKMFHV